MDAKSLLLTTALRHRINEPNIEAGFERFRDSPADRRLPVVLRRRCRLPARRLDSRADPPAGRRAAMPLASGTHAEGCRSSACTTAVIARRRSRRSNLQQGAHPDGDCFVASAPRNDNHRRAPLTNAQTHRHILHPDHRRRPDRHRPGLRVRLLRRAGVQGAEGRGLSRRAGELQSRHHHDRSRSRRRHLHRADHARDRRTHHRAREARCAAADDGRPDRAQHRHAACAFRRTGTPQRRTDRRPRRGHRARRGPPEIPRRDGRDRHRIAALRHRAFARGSARRARRSPACPPSSARASPSAAPAAASPTTARNSSRSSQAAWKPRPPPRC